MFLILQVRFLGLGVMKYAKWFLPLKSNTKLLRLDSERKLRFFNFLLCDFNMILAFGKDVLYNFHLVLCRNVPRQFPL